VQIACLRVVVHAARSAIYTRSKVEWVTIPDGVPAFDDYYDMKKLWPPESLKRVGRVLGQPVE
jgi:hypothetical protein